MALTLHGTVSDNTVALDRKTATPLIINGDMAISQRGTSLSSQSSSTRLLDRFSNDIGGGGAITISQDTDTPNSTFLNSMKMVVATADSSIAAADAYRFTYTVEGKDIATVGLGNSDCQTMTLTFWVRSSVTGTYGIGFQNSAETENYVDEYAISSANTWEKKVINIPVRTSGTWLTTNGVGLGIRWDLGSGTNYNGTADTWQTTSGKVYRTSSCVNWIATASATFYVTGVQLEVGTFDANSIPPFQHESFGDSLIRCQRYCQVFAGGAASDVFATGQAYGTTNWLCCLHLHTQMRTQPSVAFAGSASDYSVFSAAAGNVTTTSVSATNLTPDAVNLIGTTSSGLSAGNATMLRALNATASVTVTSEL